MLELKKDLQAKDENLKQSRLECEALRQDQTSLHLKSVVQSLEEEIQFLKRHYEIELNLVRD